MWKLRPISLAGTPLNSADREVHFLRGFNIHNTPVPTPITVERLGEFPSYVRTQPGAGKAFPIAFILLRETQQVLEELRDLFDPVRGLGTLILQDGDGIQKQIQAVRQGLKRDRGTWVAPLWAPDPTLLDVALSSSTITELATATSFSPNPDNIGDTDAEPKFTISPQLRQLATQGYAQMREVTYAWRSELPAAGPGSGTWLLELTEGIAWDTSVLIRVPAITTTLTTAITVGQAMPFTVTVPSTTGFDQEGVLIIEPTTGDVEQFEYNVASGTTLQLTARALGGTSAADHAGGGADVVQQSRLLRNGDDIAVFVDGVQIAPEKVSVDGMNTTNTRVWIELADSPARSAKASKAIDASDTTITFEIASHGFVVGDYVVWQPTTGDEEQARVTAVSGAVITVVRAVRNSPSAGAALVGTIVFRAGHHIQLAYNFSKAPARPANPDPPLIDLFNSTNFNWHWATTLANPPIWAENNKRAGGWRRILVGSPFGGNRNAAITVLDANGQDIRFADGEPGGSRPNFDAIEFASACGVSTAPSGIQLDASLGMSFVLNVIGRDFGGIQTLLERLDGHDLASPDPFHNNPSVYTSKQIQPSADLSSVILHARNCIVTGVFGDDNVIGITGPGEEDLNVRVQVLTLDQPTELLDLVVRTSRSGVSDKTVAIKLLRVDSNGAPEDPPINLLEDWSGISASLMPGSAFFFSLIPSVRIVLPAGQYGLKYFFDGGTTGDIIWYRHLRPIYSRGDVYIYVAGAPLRLDLQEELNCHILSAEVDNQPEAALLLGEELTIKNLEIIFDPNKTPIVDLRPEEDAYYIDLTFSAGGRTFTLRHLERWVDMDGEDVVVDVAAKTVVQTKFNDPIRSALVASTPDWLLLSPGANVVTVTPTNDTVDEDHAIEWRSAWQS